MGGSFLGIILTLAATAAAVPDPAQREEALREAARVGDVALVRSLLDSGVQVDAPAPRYGHTALLIAADRGHLDVCRLLLDRGADVNAKERFFGSTPLEIALQAGRIELAHLLLERGARQVGEALGAALERGDLALARAALKPGHLSALERKAALKQARAAGKQEFVELLEGVTPRPVERTSFSVTPERLQSYQGRYRTREGVEVVVSVKGGGLAMTGIGGREMLFMPVADGRFLTAEADAEVTFGGRGGLIEWAQVNHDGDVIGLGFAPPELQPLKSAASPVEVEAPRSEPRPWPQFRGPGGSGIADGQGVALTWNVSAGKGIRFKTPVPGIALSSPVVWGDRIFVTTAVGSKGDSTFRTGLYGDPTSVEDLSEHSFRLLALDSKSGRILWEHEVHRTAPTVRRHLKSSLANATPVTDGRHVVVLFGAVGVLAAYDYSGRKIWQQDVGVLDCNDPQSGNAEWGHASSPILHDGRVLIQADRRKDSFAAAYRLADGRLLWKVARDETSTWATPSILPGSSGDELVTNGRLIRAYDPADGKLLWSLGPNSEVVVATPVTGEGKVFLTAGYPPVRPIYAVRPGRRGDLSLPEGRRDSDAVAWSHERGGTYIPTPLYYRGHLYLLNNNGTLSCYRADNGERLYNTRLGEPGISFSASPIAADGRIYFASETGEILVLRAGPGFELLAVNAMEEVVMATPAASDGLLVVRTLGHVVGIGAPRPAAAGGGS